MPRSQRVRPQRQSSSDIENEGGSSESDRERTPRPMQKRKRSSNVFMNGNEDASFTDERIPLKTVRLNDDDAEKRRRRKSMKLVTPMMDVDDMAATPKTRPGAQVNAVDQTPAVRIPLDVMNTNFEEWMKMATDNKINVANAWNFALIDYFHDMSLLRNNGDNSINFTKASCTLEGCVKIWTTRVDSVGTETGKLLSNLANESSNQSKSDGHSDNEGDEGIGQSEKRKKNRSTEATLAKSYAQLKVKKLDLEFTVDPLFKKTSADFDEGGAGGLLMNHLALGMGHEGSMQVVFDSSDVAGADVADEDDEQPEREHLIDLSALRVHLPSLETISQKLISPSLQDFAFGNREVSFDDLTFMGPTIPSVGEGIDDEDDTWDGDRTVMTAEPGMEVDQPPQEEVDFFTGDQAVGDDLGGGFDLPDNTGMGVDQDTVIGSPPPEDDHPSQEDSGLTDPFNSRRVPNERDLVMAMAEEDGSGMMDYFDQTFLKNWAGPEHWKLRKVVRKDIPNPNEVSSKPRREKKEAFRIDFISPSSGNIKETNKKLFAQSTRGTSLTLPAAKKGKKGKEKEEQTLPDDMHFSSRQLITLFLKPSFSLRVRGGGANDDARIPGEIDEQFWAQAAAEQAAGQMDDDVDETVNGGVIPFSTQFFHEDYDDGPGFDDTGMDSTPASDAAGEGDLLAETRGLGRRVRPEAVNYAKRAKRVDVRKLKENIWKELNIVTGHKREENPLVLEETLKLTDPNEAREFIEVISGLRKTYPQDKMEEISTSFCFICLLHLANEEGLQINDPIKEERKRSMRVDAEEGEVDVEGSKVGDIWSLKIYRDPNATPAA